MIRVLLGSALAFVGLGAAVASFGPDLFAGPRGDPLVMVTPGDDGFQAASFNGGGFGATLLLATPNDVGLPSFSSEIMAFTLRMNADTIAVVIGDLAGATEGSQPVVLVFDSAGGLVSAEDPASIDAAIGDCLAAPDVAQEPI
jgi:hypothetical protein